MKLNLKRQDGGGRIREGDKEIKGRREGDKREGGGAAIADGTWRENEENEKEVKNVDSSWKRWM